ncbi:hypothetical protein AN958_06617 [Leucoagaricus sp. SymC.cos]|nr:hypothetical protein AN958_06617 [Leucoagaricus sp. SymC.cos]
MSALRAEQPSRNWWPLASKSSKQDLRAQYTSDKPPSSASKSSGRNFPSFASVIGLKSKKHPTLTIQEPPSPLRSRPTPHTRRGIPPQFHSDSQNRHQLKSPQPLSPADSIELVTPVDGPREGRQSLLTLSNNDPFAVQGITVHGPASPSHFSTHSNGSFLDVNSKQDKSSLYVRSSYSSSSSNSYSPRESQLRNSLKVHRPSADMRTLSSSKSMNNLRRKPSYVDPEPPLPIGYHSQPTSHPPTRSRGMTESGSIRPHFLQENYAATRQRRPSSPGNPPSATQSISRQASLQRLQPPTAPPTHELPAPPSKVKEEPSLEDELDILPACNDSISSSSLSFVSSISSGKEPAGNLDRHRKQEPDLQWSFVTSLRPEPDLDVALTTSITKSPLEMSPPPRAAKKVTSHGSRTKRSPPSQSSNSTSSEPPPPETHKVIRKQKSHHRLGIPPISLGFKHGHTASTSNPSSPHLPEPSAPPILDQRRGSSTSHTSVPIIPVRKRVFSGSSVRRPSTSSGAPTSTTNEDDARSLLSLRSDHEYFANASPFKPWSANMSAFGSFWEDHPSSSPVQSDYMPQPIMSPEDLAKVEAELDDISIVSALPPPKIPFHSARQRSSSSSTILSDRDSEIIPSSVFSQPLSEALKSPQMSVRSIKSTVTSVSEVGNLPAVSDAASTKLISSLSIRKTQRRDSNSSSTNPPPQLRSLPPPPRPRAKAEVVTVAESQVNLPVKELRRNTGVRNSIGVDFGHGQRYGHVASPSIQSNASHLPNQLVINPPETHTPPIPPRAVSRPPPPSYRRPRAVVGSHQPQQPQANASTGAGISRRISLQRKPSFLDIDDDDDAEPEGDLDYHAIMRTSSASSGGVNFSRNDRRAATESFLEFGRESFDTVRSADLLSERL